MKPGLLSLFGAGVDGSAIVEWLNGSSFDDLVEIDLNNNRCLNLYHVEGKYHVPSFDTSYRDIYHYALDHMVHPDDRELYASVMNPDVLMSRLEEAESPGCLTIQFRYKLENGEWRWVEKYLVSGPNYGLSEGVVHTYVFDIQNQVDREFGKKLYSYYEFDLHRSDKTRLLWEKAFLDEAGRLLKRLDERTWCVIVVDIEHFKLFNDWYGREAGDRLLAQMGEQFFKAEKTMGGVAGYLGQDDFCMLVPYDPDQIADLHDNLCSLLDGLEASAGFRPTFGICLVDDDAPILDLMDRAHLALEAARRDLRKDIGLFDRTMQERSSWEYQVLLDFQHAITNREFIAYFQPQCRISSGKIIGAEALARWRKPDGSIVPPIDFIPTLEKYGFITDLDRYIWEEVCIQLRAWIDSGHEAVPVSVNVSQADIYAIDVPDCLDNLMSKYDLPKTMLKVEITESTFAENADAVVDTTMRLREKGFMVLMDDFGSGYSSLNMLSSMNVDVIKLDAEFLRMGEEDRGKGVRIVESIINMAKTLSLPVITEGVETKDQVEFLESLGCRFIQGFYYYRPMPVEDFETLIGEKGEIDPRGFSSKANEQMRVREFLDQNIYSDSMLNNILGAVAFYRLRGDHVDIVRFNEQFYELIDVPDFEQRLVGIEKYVVPEDVPKLYDLLTNASSNYLSGASETLGFVKPSGASIRLHERAYYLGDNGEGKLFYVSVSDVTDAVNAQIQTAILSEYMPDGVVFVKRYKDDWRYKVVIHGLKDILGLSIEEAQAELDNGQFFRRVDPNVFAAARVTAREALESKSCFSIRFNATAADGEAVPLWLRADYVESGLDGVAFILTITALSGKNLVV